MPKAFRTSVWISVAVALAGVGFAHAQTTKSRHDLEHGAAEARSRASAARADEQALAGDVATQSERIDVVENDISGLGAELAEFEGQLGRSRARLGELAAEVAEKTRALARARAQLRSHNDT